MATGWLGRGWRLVARAMRLRCPACGGGDLFRSWLGLREQCPTCGLAMERDEGYFLGGMMFNLVISELLFVACLVAALVLTWPNPPWDAIWIGSVAGMVLFPIAFYPFSRTLWLAFDLFFQPATSAEPREPVTAGPRSATR